MPVYSTYAPVEVEMTSGVRTYAIPWGYDDPLYVTVFVRDPSLPSTDPNYEVPLERVWWMVTLDQDKDSATLTLSDSYVIDPSKELQWHRK